VRYDAHGGPEVLTVRTVEQPTPANGQVLIKTEAIGGSYVDTSMRRGDSAFGSTPLPGSPHGDVVGIVEAVGDGVDQALIGRRVVTLVGSDAYADYVVADAAWVLPVPASLDLGVASVLSMPAPVALRVVRTGQVSEGETVLVHAAAGVVGQLAVQLARREGAASVIATVGSADKFEFVTGLGADSVVSYSEEDWPDQVRASAPNGVDVVLDSIGGTTSTQSLGLLAPYGRLVIYGASSGELPQIPIEQVLGLHTISGFGWAAWIGQRPEQARAEMDELVELAVAGGLRTEVHGRVRLDDAPEAHRMLEDRSRVGRVLVVP